MNLSGAAKKYRIAQRTLMETIGALDSFPSGSFVLVGAHAVYLRAPEPVASLTAFTFDGDLAADPRKIKSARLIAESLREIGLTHRDLDGFYWRATAPEDEREATKIDIFVPDAFKHLWNGEGFTAADSHATTSQRGLELCLMDHSPMLIGPIKSGAEERSITVEVASVLALLVAKGWKIGERFDNGIEAFQEVAKDVADVYRLLRVWNPIASEDAIRDLPLTDEIRRIAIAGSSYLNELCGPGGDGLELLQRLLGKSEEADFILASLEALVVDFHRKMQRIF